MYPFFVSVLTISHLLRTPIIVYLTSDILCDPFIIGITHDILKKCLYYDLIFVFGKNIDQSYDSGSAIVFRLKKMTAPPQLRFCESS